MGSLVKSGRTEVTEKLRKEVNKVVQNYVNQGVAEVVPVAVAKMLADVGRATSRKQRAEEQRSDERRAAMQIQELYSQR
ncbi:hypothetical protein D9611_007946 [Ephemerocybe angulata]|uniref:TIP49 P-loop domain-containing protein n=1 Tax=Ephemerocybe angulata TaxID=980116 RepID=A0A8H5FKP6_9AGAR|nr:hypothetical protein D9611_007946 [Tulosesus angulatus]